MASFGCLDSDYLPPMPGSGCGGFFQNETFNSSA